MRTGIRDREEERLNTPPLKSGFANGVAVLAAGLATLAFTATSHAAEPVGASMHGQDFVVMEARAGAYGFEFHDLVVLDPADGRILRVLPMSPALPENLSPRPDDRLRLFPIDQGLIQTVVAPRGHAVAHSRMTGRDALNRRVNSYVWRIASGELVFVLEGAYTFALLGESSSHIAVFTEDRSVSVTEFQVWDIVGNQMVFKARFPEARRVTAHRLNSANYAAFSLDDDYLMLWDQRLRKLHRITVPEGRRLSQDRHGHAWSMLQGAVALSADERWLAFIGGPTRQKPLPSYFLIDLDQPGAPVPVPMAGSGTLRYAPFAWVSFGAGLLGASDTALHRLALPFDRSTGSWAPQAWVAQGPSSAACMGTSSQSLRDCAKAQDRERARRALLPPGAMLEAVQVDVPTRYVASNDAGLLAAWDSYNGRPIILDARRFPPREISPGRPDGSNPAALYEFRPGIPRDQGSRVAPGMLRFSHFGSHLVSFAPEPGATFAPPVELRSYAIPDLTHGPVLNPSLSDYLHARSESPGLRHPALCRLEPGACTDADAAPLQEPVVAAPSGSPSEVVRTGGADGGKAPTANESWMRRDPSRARASAPELCKAFVRIQRPIQGEPYFIDGRYEGIRITGQGEIVGSDSAIPFRDGDILFDGGWCINRVCSADEFGQALRRICASRGRGLVRDLVLEVGSADAARNLSWIMQEKP